MIAGRRPEHVGNIHYDDSGGDHFLVIAVRVIVESLQVTQPIVAGFSVLGHDSFGFDCDLDQDRCFEPDNLSDVWRNDARRRTVAMSRFQRS